MDGVKSDPKVKAAKEMDTIRKQIPSFLIPS
jgi:hypothetical protein